MKGIKTWQAVVLAVAFLGSGGGGYSWQHSSAASKAGALPANTQLASVQYGNVVNSVSASGTLSFTNVADLSFGSAGTVKQVNVAVGDVVKKGQALASLDTTNLQQAVTQAQLDVATAQTNLTNAQTPYSATDIQKAQNGVSQANLALQQAQQALADLQNPDPLTIATLQAAVDSAQAALNQLQNPDPLTVQAQQNAVTLAQLNLQSTQDALATLQAGPTAVQLAQAQATVAQDQANADAAYAALDGTAAKYAAWQLAEAKLEADQDALATLQAGPSAADLARAQATVNQASVTLQQAQQSLADLQNPDPVALAQKRNALAQAQSALQKAQQPDPLTTAQAQNAVASAQLALAQAQETLATEQAGTDPNTVSAAQLQLQVKQNTLATAQQNLAAATIVAPFDGTVTQVNFDARQAAGATATAVEVVDTSALELDATVSEMDVPKVKIGQQAAISVDAVSGTIITGKVTAVALVGKATSGVVSYPVTIAVNSPQGVQLKEGMSATATLVVQQANNVLVVPNGAISGSVRNPSVELMVDGKPVNTPVTLGLSDDTRTEIVSGVKQGDQVLESTSSSSQQRFFGGGFGGGLGGGQIIRSIGG